MANIRRLADEGKLLVAGPMTPNDRNYEGIFIFNVKTTTEAEALLASDPAVAAGALAFEAYGWYGSAALKEIVGIQLEPDNRELPPSGPRRPSVVSQPGTPADRQSQRPPMRSRLSTPA